VFKFGFGFLIGLLAGCALGALLPARFLVMLVLAGLCLAALFFLVFHLGLRDFQGY